MVQPIIVHSVLDGETKQWREIIVRSHKFFGASPSPATFGEHVWVMGTAGILHCFTADGELIWTKDLQARYGEFKIQFGMTSTPALDKGCLYLQLIHGELSPNSEETSKGRVVALDANTGGEFWKHLRETDGTFEKMHSYASPVVYRDSEREFLITHGGDFSIGHSLEDGSERWRCGGFNPQDNYNQTLRFVSSPVCGEGIIVLPSAKQGPVIAIRPEAVGDITGDDEFQLWKTEQATPAVSCPLIVDNIVYLAHQSGILTLLAAIDRDATKTHEAVPEVAARIELGEDTTASPAISGGKVFVRTIDALYAFGEIDGDSK